MGVLVQLSWFSAFGIACNLVGIACNLVFQTVEFDPASGGKTWDLLKSIFVLDAVVWQRVAIVKLKFLKNEQCLLSILTAILVDLFLNTRNSIAELTINLVSEFALALNVQSHIEEAYK